MSTIPSRSISQQHSTKALEDIPDLRIPEEFLPLDSIQRAPLQPPSPLVVKDWMLSQLSLARDLFQKQNYMQALVVVEKAKEHDYIRGLSTFPYNAASTLVARWHYQDLCLVEYCCRLLCAHEAQIGNIDIVDTLQHLNTSILEPAGKFRMSSKISFKTTFQLHQDPLLDYTFAIIAKNWSELHGASSAKFAHMTSPDQATLASAVYPFLQAISSRRLFPSTTTILQDLTAEQSPAACSRRVALDIYVALGDQKGAMQWIWLWERLDRQDWLCQWDQLDFKQWLTSRFQQSNRLDWTMDLFRLSNKASGTPTLWVQDFLDTLLSRLPSTRASAGDMLSLILHQASMDLDAFPSKKRYYQMDSWTRLDQTESWLTGIQAASAVNPQDNRTVEQELWREMAMVGVLAKDFCMEDVVRSVHPDMLATIREHLEDASQRSPTLGGYRDALTTHLEETTSMTSGSIQGSSTLSQKSIEASTVLQLVIKEVMSTTPAQDALSSYRHLLHDVAYHFALRSKHLGVVSQVVEIEIRSLKGDDLWVQTTLAAARLPHAAVQQGQSPSPLRGFELSSSTDVCDFADHYLGSDLAKMCADSTMADAGSVSNRWAGQLSNWFLAVAESSPHTGPLARSLQCQSQLLPGSHAYTKAMWVLLKDQEYDIAAALHCHAYLQDGVKDGSERTVRLPSNEEVGKLVHALVTSADCKHLERAHWIVEQHLNRAQPGSVDSASQVPSCIDVGTMTELAGAWSRRAEFDRVHRVVEIMRERDIPPNMIFYNTLLKSLVDLSPFSKPGTRTMGSGNQSGMRELGREIMVRQLLKSKQHSRDRQSGETARTDLDKGWSVLLDAVFGDSAGKIPVSGRGMDSPLMLRNLITQSSSSSRRWEGSLFRPDGHTFSILLGAFAKRGEIESISELFVEMKQLGLEPDVVICNILANAFAKRGDLKSVDRVLQEARNRNMEPGLYLTNAVLDSLVETSASASKIRETLGGMITVATETDPLASGLDSEISMRRIDRNHLQHNHVASRGRLARQPGSPSSPSGKGTPLESGLDSVTLTTLIKYHIRQNDLRSAQHVLQAMVDAGMVPDSRAYVLLLSGSIRKRDITAGLETLRAMRTQSGLYPDAKAWKGLLRCAMELEKPSQADQQQHLHPSAFNGGFQALEGRIPIKDPPQCRSRETHVALVLQELATVIDELGRVRYSPIHSTNAAGADETRKRYLLGILTSSWLSLPSSGVEEQSPRMLNTEVKGKNSLLRRLLDHFLQPAFSETVGSAGALSLSSSSSSLLQWTETKEDVLERCQQAIWLVRLVESSGIELGPKWKWDVVVRRIQKLTGQDSAVIVKELSRYADVDGAVELEDGRSGSGAKARTGTRSSKSQPRKGKEA
ncbi:hypothetical protein BGZ95_004864 [Linnemannia exigua]|uniref:Pentatricopeptide repeat-containing protein n=1 Tax=Linnemannia exigua TaxID=604196 RepID=A0AAD4H9Z7_9FUNG|nr:hypothetical protein BGZ95_004864 [Linnemannia exigua]